MNKELNTILAIEAFLQDNAIMINNDAYYKDTDIAKLYEVSIKEVHKQVRSDPGRFATDFIVNHENKKYSFYYGGILIFGGMIKIKRAIEIHLRFIEYFVTNLPKIEGMDVFEFISKIKP